MHLIYIWYASLSQLAIGLDWAASRGAKPRGEVAQPKTELAHRDGFIKIASHTSAMHIPKVTQRVFHCPKWPQSDQKVPQSDPKVGKVTLKAPQSNPKGIYKITKIRWKNVYFGRREGSWRHMWPSYAHTDPKVITKWPKRHKFWHFISTTWRFFHFDPSSGTCWHSNLTYWRSFSTCFWCITFSLSILFRNACTMNL